MGAERYRGKSRDAMAWKKKNKRGHTQGTRRLYYPINRKADDHMETCSSRLHRWTGNDPKIFCSKQTRKATRKWPWRWLWSQPKTKRESTCSFKRISPPLLKFCIPGMYTFVILIPLMTFTPNKLCSQCNIFQYPCSHTARWNFNCLQSPVLLGLQTVKFGLTRT